MYNLPVYKVQLVRERTHRAEVKKISNPGDVVEIMRDYCEQLDREHFLILMLDTKNQVRGINIVSTGTLNSSMVHPREVFKAAILSNAAAIILVHNHPSGDPAPSREDIDVTRRIADAGQLLGIEVLDHMILGDFGRYVSLKERGII